MQRVSDMLGKVIDSYQIQSVLGKGGMGVVYKAIDTSLDKVVALKVMNPNLSEDKRFLGRFKSEARALGRLHHPNIVSVFALRHVEHYLFIVMEFVEGVNLSERIKQSGPMAWQDALPIMQQTLKAIDYAHQEDIIHRDIKPHNILLSPRGVAKMTDFGLAKIQVDHADSVMATRTGFTGGTLYYMPPEQLEGLLHVDHRGDIYGLGMTYYEMIAGRTPFDKLSSEFAILKSIDAHDFVSLDQLNKDAPAPLIRIITKAIERDPDDRYQSAGAMLKDLEAWQAGDAAVPGREKGSKRTPTRKIVALPPTPSGGSKEEQRGVLASLRGVLGKGEKKSQRHPETVLTKTPLKAATPPSPVAPPPDPVAEPASEAPPPAAPPPEPVAEPASEAPSPREPEVPKDAPVLPPPASEAPPAATPPEPVAEPASEAPPPREPEVSKDAPVLPPPTSEAPPPVATLPREPAPRTERPARRRPLFIVGAAGVLLALVGLIYWGTQGFSSLTMQQGAALATDTTDTTAALASLSIRTRPDEAVVFIDSQRVGSTPLIDFAFRAGVRAFHIEKPGFLPFDTVVVLDTVETPAFTFALRESNPGSPDPAAQAPVVHVLTIRSEPPGAEVLLDGASVGQTPLTMRDPEPGARDLVLRKRGYLDYTGSITVADGSNTNVQQTLTALTATLQITVRPFGDIYVDDMLKAQRSSEPYTEEVGAGVYQVRVMHPEFGLWEKQLTINQEGTQAFLFNFDQEFDVAVTSEPDRAEILVDGQPAGTRTPGIVRVRPGRRTIAVRRRGYVMDDAARVLTLEANRTAEPLHFTLRAVQ